MLPFLAIGHISPFLELAKNLSDNGFSIHLCSTPINLNFIKTKIPTKYSSSIRLLPLHLPDSPHLPPHYHTTNALPPHLTSAFDAALSAAQSAFSDVMKNLAPDLFVYDVLMPPWAAGVAAAQNVPAVQFFTSSSAMCAYLAHVFHRPSMEYPLLELNLTRNERERIYRLIGEKRDSGRGVFDDNMMVISTSSEIEGKYVDYLGEIIQENNLQVLVLGAMVQDLDLEDEGDSDLFEWLGTKPENSTLFICFGSECVPSKEAMEEIAFGLALTGVNFLWVIRFPKGELPEGFIEMVGERGRVVEGWAPQARILAHPSVGGFLSHCGWNSVLEGVYYGVPIIVMPMHRVDQAVNGRLVVEIGVGVEVVRDGDGKFGRGEVARVVKDVMGGEVGEDMRRNVRKIGEKVRVASVEEMGMAAKVLAQLCKNNNGQFAL
nr:beta-D-glucosyl crocetin beta-1,6-glucosyltransferase-like [Ipomoea batatas]